MEDEARKLLGYQMAAHLMGREARKKWTIIEPIIVKKKLKLEKQAKKNGIPFESVPEYYYCNHYQAILENELVELEAKAPDTVDWATVEQLHRLYDVLKAII
jgi:hypothetical protein